MTQPLKFLLSFMFLMWNLSIFAMDESLTDAMSGFYHVQISKHKLQREDFTIPENLYGKMDIIYTYKNNILFMKIYIEFDDNEIDYLKLPMQQVADFFSKGKLSVPKNESSEGLEERVGFQGIISEGYVEGYTLRDIDSYVALGDTINPNAMIVYQFKFLDKKLSSCRIQMLKPGTNEWYTMVALKNISKLSVSCRWDDF